MISIYYKYVLYINLKTYSLFMNKREDAKMKESMDELIGVAFDGLKIGNDYEVSKKEYTTISFCVPKDYKKKFEELQNKTNKGFGRTLRGLFIHSIDKFSV